MKPSRIAAAKHPRSVRVRHRCALQRTAIAVFLLACVAGCAKGTYRVTVDAPPREAPVGLSTMIVGDFTGGSASANAGVRRAIENRLVQEGAIKPVTSGTDVTLTGTYDVDQVRTTRDRSSFEVTVKEDGKKRKKTIWTYTVRKSGSASLTYALRSKGQLLAGNTFRRSFDDSWSGDSADAASAEAPTDSQIQSALIGKLVDELVTAVSPHRESRDLPLRGRMNPDIAKGIDYLQQNRFDQAIQIWQHVVDTATSSDEKAAAYYNIGVIREVRGEYRDAFLMYTQADQLEPGDREYIAALARVEKLQRDRDLLDLGASAGK